MNALFYFLFLSLCDIIYGLRIPVTARSQKVVSRAAQNDTAGVQMWQAGKLDNANDIFYATNLTVGNKTFPVQIDTGSSDLWIKPPDDDVTFTNQTQVSVLLTYGQGRVEGNIASADVAFGPYEVNGQGLAFDQSSEILNRAIATQAFGADGTRGRTFLGNIFTQNTTAPNVFTVLLGRRDDPSGEQWGTFTIGEYIPDYQNITEQPKLSRTPAQLPPTNDDPLRWSVEMEKILVNGKEFTFNTSVVAEAASERTVVLLDTGATFSQLPAAAVDFIYSNIPGAVFNNDTKLWDVPCENTTTVEFVFEHNRLLVHPLDLTTASDSDDATICHNTFQNFEADPSLNFDAVMGVPFLKNVYASFNFGDAGKDNETLAVPFVQMVSTTPHADEALKEFQQVRSSRSRRRAFAAPITTDSTFDFQRRGHDTSSNSIGMPSAERKLQMVVSGHFHLPFTAHRMPPGGLRHCTHSAFKSHPVLVIFWIFLMPFTCTILVMLTLMYLRSRHADEEGYEPIPNGRNLDRV